jgi:hypothetical protein
MVGTRDMRQTYRELSSGTPYCPFLGVSVPPFTAREVRSLVEVAIDAALWDLVSKHVFARTAGYRALTQRFLYEVARAGATQDEAGIDLEACEARVGAHDDPNWNELLGATRSNDLDEWLERLANRETVLDVSGRLYVQLLLATGIVLRHGHQLTIGNSYYQDRVATLWRTAADAVDIGGERSARLSRLRQRRRGTAGRSGASDASVRGPQLGPDSRTTIFAEEVHVGDVYNNFGSAGAVGRDVHIETVAFEWAGNLLPLADQLQRLAEEMKEMAETSEQHKTVVEIWLAEASARGGDERATLTHLRKAGRWAHRVATDVGAAVAAAAISSAISG